jgi:Tfp pilus tip-associated adhesin PilY1
LIEPPREFAYLALNLTPRPGEGYPEFAALHEKRRKVVMVGSNDGFYHGFDGGVFDRDTTVFPNGFDLGTGREIFAYAPKGAMRGKFPALIAYPPRPQYFVDGSAGTADVFIDPVHGGTPTAGEREWRTVVVGTLRQGGPWVFGLDVTYPDQIDTTTTSPTFGEKTDAKNDSPDCANGGGSCPSRYPEVMWEITDDCLLVAPCEGIPKMGETWSKPVVGRIRISNGAAFEDRYVAIFGGGFDPSQRPGDPIRLTDELVAPFRKATRGWAIYVVDVETGKIIYKGTAGFRNDTTAVNFAPIAAGMAAIDWDDDGYLDAAYVGDINGRIWRLDLIPDALSVASPRRGELVAGKLTYRPFLLYDASTSASEPLQPFFLDAGLIFMAGGPRPVIGVALGSGDRSELARPNLRPVGASLVPFKNRAHLVVDSGQVTTAEEDNLRNITPGNDGLGPYNSGCSDGTYCTGFRLDFESQNEKGTSTMFATDGFLSLVTFTPDATNPCATEGNSFRYRFFYLTGSSRQGTNNYAEYRDFAGGGYASPSQSNTKSETNDWIFSVGGGVRQEITTFSVTTINQNWKEQ